jgi:hypothetical protein
MPNRAPIQVLALRRRRRRELAAGDRQSARVLRAHLPQRSEISVVDVFKQPERALADSVMMTPMLIKLAPAPWSAS